MSAMGRKLPLAPSRQEWVEFGQSQLASHCYVLSVARPAFVGGG
jgi:hypothetical protein